MDELDTEVEELELAQISTGEMVQYETINNQIQEEIYND